MLTISLKFFMHPDLDDFRKLELVTRFRKVVVDKPKESRKGTLFRRDMEHADKAESSEAYFVCLGYKG
jgi:23S rRNA (uridine2552-2'-O)-methyltransferase